MDFQKHWVIVIDGLDECHFEIHSELAKALAVLISMDQLPACVKILLLSRQTHEFTKHLLIPSYIAHLHRLRSQKSG